MARQIQVEIIPHPPTNPDFHDINFEGNINKVLNLSVINPPLPLNIEIRQFFLWLHYSEFFRFQFGRLWLHYFGPVFSVFPL